jgi:hypothetical protein
MLAAERATAQPTPATGRTLKGITTMKTLLAALIALGTLSGAANAQYVRVIGHGYNAGPEYCAPGTTHLFQNRVTIAPRIVAPVQQAEAPAEAPADAPAAAPEAPADDAAPLQAPLPPK